ncbi:MAG TPA: hypothetical protein VLT59_13765 [Steroidobacteraceae bacterium]|nr:hypothetical protein [Steroidobacteraceae bacterium]
MALNGDGIVAEFAIPGDLIPSEWYGDTEQPRSLPPYARTFLTTAESIVTIYNPSVCHQENSIVTVESVDPETLKRTVSQRDLPAVPTQADTIRVVHEYHCDSIDHEPVRWMDIDLFSMLPGVESIRITASADGATLMRDGVLKPEARRIEFLKDEAPPEG